MSISRCMSQCAYDQRSLIFADWPKLKHQQVSEFRTKSSWQGWKMPKAVAVNGLKRLFDWSQMTSKVELQDTAASPKWIRSGTRGLREGVRPRTRRICGRIVNGKCSRRSGTVAGDRNCWCGELPRWNERTKTGQKMETKQSTKKA